MRSDGMQFREYADAADTGDLGFLPRVVVKHDTRLAEPSHDRADDVPGLERQKFSELQDKQSE
jgi:hypothetical protein